MAKSSDSTSSSTATSPGRLLLITAASIFVCEAALMVVLAMLPEMPSLVLAALDATFLSVLVFPLLFLLVYRPVRRHILQREHSNAEKEAAVLSLRKAFDEIDSLRGLLTICAHCKKIQDEEGEWQDVETYVRRHSEADFSHAICPECSEQMLKEYELNASG